MSNISVGEIGRFSEGEAEPVAHVTSTNSIPSANR